MKQRTNDEKMMYAWGKAFHELKDNPYFQKYQQMIHEVINRLQGSMCNDEPDASHELNYAHIMIHRAGQVKGLKNLIDLQEKYNNNFVNNNEKEDLDEDVEEYEEKSRRRRR